MCFGFFFWQNIFIILFICVRRSQITFCFPSRYSVCPDPCLREVIAIDMPDTQFMRCLQYDTGTRRLSERLGDIQREDGVENRNDENGKFILKHEESIQSIETFHKLKIVEDISPISPSSAADLPPFENVEKRQIITNVLRNWLSCAVEKGIPMRAAKISSHQLTEDRNAIRDNYACVTKEMIEKSNLLFSSEGLPYGRVKGEQNPKS